MSTNFSVGSHVEIQSNSTIFKLKIVNNYAYNNKLPILVNDVLQYVLVGTGTSDVILELAAGSKTIKFIKETLSGVCYISQIDANEIIPVQKYYKSEKWLFIGDSITVGANALQASTNSYIGLLRRNNTDKTFIVDAESGIRVSTYNSNRRANACNNITSLGIQKVWIALGTNGESTIDILKTEYAALIDAIIAANSSIMIYCQTPILSDIEALYMINARQAISEVVATKTNCILVNGLTMLNDADKITDGTHPNTAGHLEYYNNIKTYLGLN